MGVDGFSMASLSMPKDITSAQAAATVEQQVGGIGEKVVNKIDRAINKKINNDEEKEKKNQYFEDGFKEKDEDEEEDEEGKDKDKEESAKFESNSEKKSSNVKKYKHEKIKDPENLIVRYNGLNDKIELYNKASKKTVETIKPEAFVEMISKLDYNSGVLVNKKI